MIHLNSENNVYFKKYKLLNFGNKSFVSELGINNNLQMRYTSFLTFSSLKDTVLHFFKIFVYSESRELLIF